MKLLMALLACFTLSNAKAVSVTELVNTQFSWNHIPVRFPTVEPSRVVAKKIILGPGEGLDTHFHYVQVTAYVVEGSITLHDEMDQVKTFKTGDVIVEGRNLLHRSVAGQNGAHIIAFYLSGEGLEESVAVIVEE